MLSIILFILKLIGIVLAFIVLLVLTILIIPIKYNFYAEYDKELLAKGKVSYLFRIIVAKVNYVDNLLVYTIHLFGHKIYDSTKKELYEKRKAEKLQQQELKAEEKKRKLQKKTSRKNKNQIIAHQMKSNSKELDSSQGRKESISQNLHVKQIQKIDSKKSSLEMIENRESVPCDLESMDTSIRNDNETRENTVCQKDAELKADTLGILNKAWALLKESGSKLIFVFNKIKGLKEKIKKVLVNIVDKYETVKKNVVSIKNKVKQIKAFAKKIMILLQEEDTKASLKHIYSHLKKVIKHSLPRKIKGEIEFGRSDPYDTGKILAIASSTYGLYGKYLKIYPNFEEEILRGNVNGKGQIRIIYFIWIGFKLIIYDKNRILLGKIKNLKEEL